MRRIESTKYLKLLNSYSRCEKNGTFEMIYIKYLHQNRKLLSTLSNLQTNLYVFRIDSPEYGPI